MDRTFMLDITSHIIASHHMGFFVGKKPEMDDLEVPPFEETSICWGTPTSFILIGFSNINHRLIGLPPFMHTLVIYIYPLYHLKSPQNRPLFSPFLAH